MEIEEAEDGKEAGRKINEFVPDLIFIDIKLPGENGLELTERIKSAFPDVAIIILTSHDLPEYRQAAGEMGASHFFVKGSSTADEILDLVKSIFSDTRPIGNS
jgi:YesN/AraC family two-component response regulator